MSKSIWKFTHISTGFFKKFFLNKFKILKFVKIFSRNSTVTQSLLRKTPLLYKGNVFSKIFLSKYSIGYKIGEFAITRKPFSFPKKNKKIKR